MSWSSPPIHPAGPCSLNPDNPKPWCWRQPSPSYATRISGGLQVWAAARQFTYWTGGNLNSATYPENGRNGIVNIRRPLQSFMAGEVNQLGPIVYSVEVSGDGQMVRHLSVQATAWSLFQLRDRSALGSCATHRLPYLVV